MAFSSSYTTGLIQQSEVPYFQSQSYAGSSPVNIHTVNFTSSISYMGSYNIVGGLLTCSIQTGSLLNGAEFEFFQTSSGDNFLFVTGSPHIDLIVKNGNMNLAGQGSGASLKFISGDIFHLVGDLT